VGSEHYATDNNDAAAKALRDGGVDINCGGVHTVLVLCSLILCSSCPYTVLILPSYCAHTVLILYSSVGGLTDNICKAIQKGLVDERVLDASLHRSLGLLFEAGMFDDVTHQPYTRIPFETIGSDAHHARALDASRQAMVLLKNEKNTLPIVAPTIGSGDSTTAAKKELQV
jgi:beta-glucosidase-like glycosyl hydrolase